MAIYAFVDDNDDVHEPSAAAAALLHCAESNAFVDDEPDIDSTHHDMTSYAFVDDDEEKMPGHATTAGHSDKFYSDALAAAPLSEETKRSYASKIKRLQDITGDHHTTHWVLSHPAQVYARLVDNTKDSTTRAVCIAAVSSMFRHIPGLKQRHADAYAEWGRHLKFENAETVERYDSNKPTPRQAAAHVPWEQVRAARDALPKDSVEYLLLAMYSYLPPVRCDYGRLAIHYKEPTPSEKEDEPNYVCIKGPRAMTMHLNAYKTKKAGRDGMTQDLPPHLCDVVWASLEREPREFLFNEVRSGNPFKGADAYTKWAARIFKRVLGNPNASTNTLRHAYLSWLDTQQEYEVSEGMRKDIARQMCHSPAMGRAYIFKPDGKPLYDVTKEGA